MLSLLFDSKFWYGAMIVCAIVAVIYLCFKYPGSRVYVASFVVIVLLGLTAYCGIQLNYYYSAEGGIYGKLTGIVTNNTVEKLEETKFSLSNLVLTENENGEFSAIILSDDKLDLDSTSGKYMFVNGLPCSTSESLTNGIFGTYHYSFKDNSTKELIDDTLLISFSYFENGYRLKLSTEGGQNAVDYWNTYFSRNNFVITIEDFNYSNIQDFEIHEDKLEEYVTLNYYIDNEISSVVQYPKNSIISNFYKPVKTDYVFLGWSLDRTNIIRNLKLEQNTNLHAVFVKEILFQESDTVEIVEICPNNITDFCQIDLNEYFDFQFPENVTISFELEAENENVQGKYFAIEGEISTGQSIECIRNDYDIHFSTIKLRANGELSILAGEDVPELQNVQLRIRSVKAF